MKTLSSEKKPELMEIMDFVRDGSLRHGAKKTLKKLQSFMMNNPCCGHAEIWHEVNELLEESQKDKTDFYKGEAVVELEK